MNAIRTILAAAASLAPAAAFAHPGDHPADLAWDLAHIFTEPDHLITMGFGLLWAGMLIAVGYWFKPWRADSWRECWRDDLRR
jgi:hydrogenase/urease accessory protein HupE